MEARDNQKQRITRVAREMSSVIRQQARGRWKDVRTAERNERGRHVWRFQDGPESERFLHVDHRAMAQGVGAAERLLGQLDAGQWLDRLQQGPETAFLLSRDGTLAAYAG